MIKTLQTLGLCLFSVSDECT